MPATLTVLYPSGADIKFDLDYYCEKHMKLAMDSWGPFGMKSYQVTKNLATAGGEPSPYVVQATLQFTSIEDFKKAKDAPASKTVLADVPNFTNSQPILIIGDEVASK